MNEVNVIAATPCKSVIFGYLGKAAALRYDTARLSNASSAPSSGCVEPSSFATDTSRGAIYFMRPHRV